MSQSVLFPAPGGTLANGNDTYEPFGFGTGAGVQCTTGAGNVKGGSWSPTAGATVNAWSGFILSLGPGNNAGARYLVDISFDGGASTAISNLFVQPNSTGVSVYRLPINVPAGSDIRIRAQASSGTLTINAAFNGRIRNAAHPPGYTSMVPLAASSHGGIDTSTTIASSVDIPTSNAWTQVSDLTAAAFGGLFGVVSPPGSNAFTAAQTFSMEIGLGAPADPPAHITKWMASVATSGTPVQRGHGMVIEKTIAAGSKISARILAATTTDNARVALYGLVV